MALGLLIGLVVGFVLGGVVLPVARRSFRRVVVDLREAEAEEDEPSPIERRAREDERKPRSPRTWT